MEWIKYSEHNLPPQGLKVLCFTKGDAFVAQTFNYKGKRWWVPIPFSDSKFALKHSDPPEYWAYIKFPRGYEGYIEIGVTDNPKKKPKTMRFDEFEKQRPEDHEEFVGMLVENLGKFDLTNAI